MHLETNYLSQNMHLEYTVPEHAFGKTASLDYHDIELMYMMWTSEC
jgi:hypothetical protein